jgi:uncharacterized protein YbbC (DUF1343 family)/molybdopterin-guanine dinucleotide biosynthesis protein
MKKSLQTGLDAIVADPSSLLGKKVGLVANQASVTSRFVPALDALRGVGVDVRVVFGPEHGYFGAAQDMIPVSGEGTRVPVYSLYGETFGDLSPSPLQLAGLDAVVCDLPDVGSRYYTFVWTTALVLGACGDLGIPVIVLDRPNPLGGIAVEGNLPESPLLSFVGLHPVPARHGMTPGEVARWVRDERGIACELEVVPLRLAGESRPAPRSSVGEVPAWVLPSPNMPTRETALVYPGMCLLEGVNLSEGRGTTRPFETVGAPWLDADEAAAAANALGLPGIVFRPHVFRPTFHKHAGKTCGGLQLHVTDPVAFRPFETGLRLVKALRDLDPGRFAWRTERYEYRDDVPAVDLLAGTARYRELVDAGDPLDGWLATFEADLARFEPSRQRAMLYGPPGGGTAARVVQVVGAHDSGKTSLAVRLVEALASEGLRVGAVKHTPKEVPTDLPGKDSERLAAAGAEPTAFLSAGRSAVHRHDLHDLHDLQDLQDLHDIHHGTGGRPGLADLLEREFGGCDLVVVEGLKGESFPKIEVCRAATGREPLLADDPLVFAVLTDRETAHSSSVPRFGRDGFAPLLALVRARLGLDGEARVR